MATAVVTCQEERLRVDHVINTGNPKRLINEILDDPNQWNSKERQVISAGKVTPAVCSAFVDLYMSEKRLRKHMNIS